MNAVKENARPPVPGVAFREGGIPGLVEVPPPARGAKEGLGADPELWGTEIQDELQGATPRSNTSEKSPRVMTSTRSLRFDPIGDGGSRSPASRAPIEAPSFGPIRRPDPIESGPPVGGAGELTETAQWQLDLMSELSDRNPSPPPGIGTDPYCFKCGEPGHWGRSCPGEDQQQTREVEGLNEAGLEEKKREALAASGAPSSAGATEPAGPGVQ